MANFATRVTNILVGPMGLNLFGAKVLTVHGRKSGEPRSVVVNPLTLENQEYLLSPRGESQWVKNIRVNPSVTLKRGRHADRWIATELEDDDVKLAVMRAYLERWSWQVNQLMGVSKGSTDKELRSILDRHPIFLLERE